VLGRGALPSVSNRTKKCDRAFGRAGGCSLSRCVAERCVDDRAMATTGSVRPDGGGGVVAMAESPACVSSCRQSSGDRFIGARLGGQPAALQHRHQSDLGFRPIIRRLDGRLIRCRLLLEGARRGDYRGWTVLLPQGSLTIATTICGCFVGCFAQSSTDIAELITLTGRNAARGVIDDDANQARHRIWLFSGTSDTIVPGTPHGRFIRLLSSRPRRYEHRI
jgi:hypothetical protein